MINSMILERDYLEEESKGSGAFNQYLKEIKQFPSLSKEEEIQLKRELTDFVFKSRLINSCLRLVVSIARKFIWSGLDLEDLVQEGNLGLVQASNRYDINNEAKFSSFAARYIWGYIMKAVKNKGLTRIPCWLSTELNRVAKVSREIYSKEGNIPSKEDISNKMGWTGRKAKHFKEDFISSSYPIYLSDLEMGDKSFVDEKHILPLKEVEEKIEMDLLREEMRNTLLSKLKVRDRKVIEEMIKSDYEGGSLREMGKQFSCSRETVRQLIIRSVNHMRKEYFKKDLEIL